MKQVLLKIEELFNGEISYRVKGKGSFANKVVGLIQSKLIGGYYTTRPNESRETIIKALWEFQNGLLPSDDFTFDVIKNSKPTYITDWNEEEVTDIEFYNPDTRIITITDFNA